MMRKSRTLEKILLDMEAISRSEAPDRHSRADSLIAELVEFLATWQREYPANISRAIASLYREIAEGEARRMMNQYERRREALRLIREGKVGLGPHIVNGILYEVSLVPYHPADEQFGVHPFGDGGRVTVETGDGKVE
jgi:hypothetical protein